MRLTSDNVEQVFKSCLSDTVNGVMYEGVKTKAYFDVSKIKWYADVIDELLSQCHPDFFVDGDGGGDTFLNFCMDMNEDIWSGSHLVCDHLICLGLAVGRIEFLLPRDMWFTLPGNVPCLRVIRVKRAVSLVV